MENDLLCRDNPKRGVVWWWKTRWIIKFSSNAELLFGFCGINYEYENESEATIAKALKSFSNYFWPSGINQYTVTVAAGAGKIAYENESRLFRRNITTLVSIMSMA